jgi:hypothetical protein
MQAQRKDRRGDLIPVIAVAIVAVVGQTLILFDDFGNARMVTAAVVSKAGAIEIPSQADVGRL